MKHGEVPDGEWECQRGERAAPLPPEAWIDAFDEQLSEPMLKEVRRFAVYRASTLGWEGAGNDAYYAEELVQNAVADTRLGVLRWDPSVNNLHQHLVDAVRLRSRRDRAHAERYPHVSLDECDRDDDDGASGGSVLSPEAEATLQVTAPATTDEHVEHEASAARATAIAAKLRELSEGDPIVQRFLDATDRDACTRADVMRLAGLTSAEYHNARRRLARLVAQLPRHLQCAMNPLAEEV
jgi:hypothetical protein